MLRAPFSQHSVCGVFAYFVKLLVLKALDRGQLLDAKPVKGPFRRLMQDDAAFMFGPATSDGLRRPRQGDEAAGGHRCTAI